MEGGQVWKIHRQILRGDKRSKGKEEGRCRKVEAEVLVAVGSVVVVCKSGVCNGGWIEIKVAKS